MNNSSHKANKVSVAILAALIAVTASFASVMTGCGCEKESSSTGATVSDTTLAATDGSNAIVTNEKSESEQGSQSSNAESSNTQNTQTSEKSESEVSAESSKAESKAETSKNETSSKTSDKTLSNSSNNSSGNNNNNNGETGEDITLTLKKGNTITVTYSVKSTVVLTNYQATISYDSSKLKVKKAELQKPATSNGIINAKQTGKILFNGSDITTGYDYTKGGNLVVVTFEATSDGSTTVDWLWQSASTLDEKNNIISHIDGNGKSDGTVTLTTSYK